MQQSCVLYSHLEVPAVHPDGCLRQRQVTDKAEVQRPDPRMLSNWKSSECTVKCLTTSCYLALRHKELAVIKPYSRHLVRGKTSDQCQAHFLDDNVIPFCIVKWFNVEFYRRYYLMHEHQCPFMAIIDLFIAWFSDTFPFDLLPPLS